MIAKEQVDVIDQYAQSIVSYVDTQQKTIVVQLKTATIQKLNEVTIVHYQKNLDKINQIREEFEETKSICKLSNLLSRRQRINWMRIFRKSIKYRILSKEWNHKWIIWI
ncbi:unnamed protein product (macronuclear) [Paramecium tetraurelia]|uniref:Uncharacterized protein n=1 Tax=Paramecium tetraurelia TaxID=5888 RepID=A0C1Y6_PARTE|nr:uncharacterized protein GSPATT00034280001 [Paramecium tetraurelia]CAK64803.1 unnamed protein product [Paramecium tetraurelia]|eukprot:XP_001432200.1 hypothetical protein (macronuclear) [Paramecium tetraurelia strain d4-2]